MVIIVIVIVIVIIVIVIVVAAAAAAAVKEEGATCGVYTGFVSAACLDSHQSSSGWLNWRATIARVSSSSSVTSQNSSSDPEYSLI